MTLPRVKVEEVIAAVRMWEAKSRATLKEIQSLFGLLQFVSTVAPTAKLFTNRILDTLREMGSDGHTTLLWGLSTRPEVFSRSSPKFQGY